MAATDPRQMTAAERRKEIVGLLSTAMLRLAAHPDGFSRASSKLSKESGTRLEAGGTGASDEHAQIERNHQQENQ